MGSASKERIERKQEGTIHPFDDQRRTPNLSANKILLYGTVLHFSERTL
jgi:hypothetical protein